MKKQAPSLEQERAEKLQEIGSCLRELRQEQAIPLEEIAAKTKIQLRLLNAIEAGRLDQLPEPVYIQSFIRQFADALGANGTDIASQFPTRTVLRPLQASWRNLPAAQLRPIHLYVLYVFLIVFAVNSLSYLMNRSAPGTLTNIEAYQVPNNEPGASQTPVVTRQVLGPVNPFAASNAAKQNNTKLGATSLASLLPIPGNTNSKPVQVSVIFKAQSWIRVVTDGKTEFEGVLPEGTQRTWMADEQLTLRAGNAGGILVGLNGEQAKQLGDPGAVEEVTFEAGSQAAIAPRSFNDESFNEQTPFGAEPFPVASEQIAAR